MLYLRRSLPRWIPGCIAHKKTLPVFRWRKERLLKYCCSNVQIWMWWALWEGIHWSSKWGGGCIKTSTFKYSYLQEYAENTGEPMPFMERWHESILWVALPQAWSFVVLIRSVGLYRREDTAQQGLKKCTVSSFLLRPTSCFTTRPSLVVFNLSQCFLNAQRHPRRHLKRGRAGEAGRTFPLASLLVQHKFPAE